MRGSAGAPRRPGATGSRSGWHPAIEARGLTKRFGTAAAVDAVDLDVAPGEIFGLVGPNGAGKTTLLQLLAALLDPTAGRAAVLGADVVREAAALQRRIGYLSQEFTLYGTLSVEENLDFFADLYGVRSAARERRKEELLAWSRLARFRERRAEKLSGGMQKNLLHAHPRSRAPAAGRAHHGRGPGLQPGAVGDPARPGRARPDARGGHPLHGRGGAVPPRRPDASGLDSPLRHPGRAPRGSPGGGLGAPHESPGRGAGASRAVRASRPHAPHGGRVAHPGPRHAQHGRRSPGPPRSRDQPGDLPPPGPAHDGGRLRLHGHPGRCPSAGVAALRDPPVAGLSSSG
jgi:ABC transporter